MRPKISDHKRHLLHDFPLARIGVTFSEHERRAIEDWLTDGNTAAAQQVVLDKLARAFDGPRTRATMRPGDRRKRMVKA